MLKIRQSGAASNQYQELVGLLHQFQLSMEENDVCSAVIFGATIPFPPKMLIGYCNASQRCRWMRRSCCKGNHRFFFCLLLRDTLNTRNLLRTKTMYCTWMIIIVCCAQPKQRKLFCICSSTALSANGAGAFSRLTGTQASHLAICC
jgi:hypothetical protein